MSLYLDAAGQLSVTCLALRNVLYRKNILLYYIGLLQAASTFLVTITSHLKCYPALREKLEGEAELLVINIRQGGN